MSTGDEVVIGADVDVRKLMAEVRAEVQRKRDAGLYPPAVLAELDLMAQVRGGDAEMRIALEGLRQSAEFSVDVTTASSKRFVSPIATAFKRGVRASIGWYVSAIVQQLEVFAARVVRAIRVIADRADSQAAELRADRDDLRTQVDDLARQVDTLTDRIRQLEAKPDGSGEGARDRH